MPTPMHRRQTAAPDYPAPRKAVDRRASAGARRLGRPQTHLHPLRWTDLSQKLGSDGRPGAGADHWTFIELDIPRDGMLTHPDLVSDTLGSFALLDR